MKIIVADDDPTIRTIVTAGLDALGHRVTAYENGKLAWNAFQESPCQLLIVDWGMPEMDGLNLTQSVRMVAWDGYTYVIMLTGRSARDDYLKAIRAGADAFLVKPLDLALLEAQVTIAQRIVGLQEHARKMEARLGIAPSLNSSSG